jgi:hypothetical protein
MRALKMDGQTVFSISHPWLVAEGAESGKPSLFRGREIPIELVGDPTLPHLFVIAVAFDVADFTGLPTEAQYRMIADFESLYVDRLEAARIGVVTFIKTCNGVVRYFLYVADVDAASSLLVAPSAADLRVELAAAYDAEWREYRAFLRGARRDDSPA